MTPMQDKTCEKFKLKGYKYYDFMFGSVYMSLGDFEITDRVEIDSSGEWKKVV